MTDHFVAFNTPVRVSELNRAVAHMLERSFPLVSVRGEISNFTRAASGHWYFSLKDDQAQVRCVMFKGRAQWADFLPRDGDQVEVSAQVRLYEPRGDYQLVIDAMQRAGVGVLLEAFVRLKEKLAAQGLLAAERKRALPVFVKTVGIVTSPEAAALHDVVATLQARAPYVRLLLYPTPVQGAEAAKKITQALMLANRHAQADVLILCRGGGSIEDLWAFNDEDLAHAIADSSLPIVSGIGHETDFTIADFVADLRAATPTAAAQAVARPRDEWLGLLSAQQRQLSYRAQRLFETASMRLDWATRRLISPTQRLGLSEEKLAQLQGRLRRALQQRWQQRTQQLQQMGGLLAAFSPQATLKRGYVIVRHDARQGSVVTHATQVSAGAHLRLEFQDGERVVQA